MNYIEGIGIYGLMIVAVFSVPIFIDVVYKWFKTKRDNRYARKWLSDHPEADWIDFFKHSNGER